MHHSIGPTLWPLLLLSLTCAAAGQPCTRTDSSCIELIPAAGGNLTVFRTFPINSGSPKVERAFLMVHGVLGFRRR